MGNIPSALAANGLPPLTAQQLQQFESYLALLRRWNVRTNLVSRADLPLLEERHLPECVLAATLIPPSVTRMADFGSGSGFPAIPIAVLHPHLHLTLIEAHTKKAAFLNEVIRSLNLNARVFAGRGEALAQTFSSQPAPSSLPFSAPPPAQPFQLVSLRAVEHMPQAIATARTLLQPSGLLLLLTTHAQLGQLPLLPDSTPFTSASSIPDISPSTSRPDPPPVHGDNYIYNQYVEGYSPSSSEISSPSSPHATKDAHGTLQVIENKEIISSNHRIAVLLRAL